ncbi:PAXNEB protein-domain-containing protein [Annulohypoxylon bovei var. microspora]|nr:PAXNEB protein-domain-containing protein [Annulohypoxylon bovei var. microspora]
MSFRKRNAVISSSNPSQSTSSRTENAPIPGVRPSPLDGRSTTSTGTASLDSLLAGHAGLPLGTSLLIGEHGTTDFAGVLLRYYAAEGMVQGHQVHVLGMHEAWRHELPGLSTDDKRSSSKSESPSDDKMKIAWRYESLSAGGAPRDRNVVQRQNSSTTGTNTIFCHSFDLTKRLGPTDAKGQIGFHPSMSVPGLSRPKSALSPFKQFIKDIAYKLANSPASWIHRVIVPSLLSPTSYSSSSICPEEVLQFLHALRGLLRQYPTRLTAIISLPLSLYPRTTGLTRWMELLSDGVFELIPLQSTAVHVPPPSSKSGSKSDEQTQGLVKVHSLPIFHEKGGGSSESYAAHGDLSFSLSRSRGLVIKPFYLPPVGYRYCCSVVEMAFSTGDRPPVRICKVAGRYLLFDIDDIMHLRRHHNICSVFVGTIPQNPQQNIFMGLPVELMPEEAQVLVDKKVGYVVDDAAFHPARLSALDDDSRRRYLQSVKADGRKAQLTAAELKESFRPKIINKKKAKSKTLEEVPSEQDALEKSLGAEGELDTDLFAPPSPSSLPSDTAPPSRPSKALEEPTEFAITPTTSSLLFPAPSQEQSAALTSVEVAVPPSYPLYAHLQDRGYYMMPGLRFGCDYNVYPGDPLRFHSHFQAASHGWDDEVAVLDLVAGGRLGTNVKKGYLIGGAVGDDVEADGMSREGNDDLKRVDGSRIANPNPNAPKVRTFTIEWGAM